MKSIQFKSTIALFWSVVLTAVTLIFGAAPLNVYRKTVSPKVYYVSGLALVSLLAASGQWAFALILLSLFSLIGIFCEFDLRGAKLLNSSFYAVLGTSLVVWLAFAGWASTIDGSWHAYLLEKINLALQASTLPAEVKSNLKVSELLLQLPSVVVAILTVSLSIALIFEKKLMAMMGIIIVRKEPLNRLKLPEPLVFLLIVALAGSFLHNGIKVFEVLGTNFLNICSILYFLQGIAIVSNFFEVFKIGVLWRAILMALLVIQMMPAVAILGVLDIWLDFRERFLKRATEMKKKGL